MEAEVTIEIHHRTSGDRNPGPLPVILLLAMRHDHAEPVNGAALEEAHQGAAAGRLDGWTAGVRRP